MKRPRRRCEGVCGRGRQRCGIASRPPLPRAPSGAPHPRFTLTCPTLKCPQAFNALRDTFDILTDEKKRKAYDDQLAREEWKAAQRRGEQRAAAARVVRAAAVRLGTLALTHRRVTLGLVLAAAVLMRMPSAEPPSEV